VLWAGKATPSFAVGLVDDARLVGLHEVHGDAKVDSGQIGESMRCHLVRGQIAITQIFDLRVLVVFGVPQVCHRPTLWDQHRRGEVVDLDSLGEELGVIGGRSVLKHDVSQCGEGEGRWAAPSVTDRVDCVKPRR
jgi:hypothetical protein